MFAEYILGRLAPVRSMLPAMFDEAGGVTINLIITSRQEIHLVEM